MIQITPAALLEVGERLRFLRKAKGVSAQVVARDALGFDTTRHAAISRLERGVTKAVPDDQMAKLAAYYGVTVTDLLDSKSTVIEDIRREAIALVGAAISPSAEPAGQPSSFSSTVKPAQKQRGEPKPEDGLEPASPIAPFETISALETEPLKAGALEPIASAPAIELPPAEGAKQATDGVEQRNPSAQARLQGLRLKLKLSPSDFAALLRSKEVSVTERDVTEWEAAAKRPNSLQFAELVRVTGATEHWIKTGKAGLPPKP